MTACTKSCGSMCKPAHVRWGFASSVDPANPQSFEEVTSQALTDYRSGPALVNQLGAGRLLNSTMRSAQGLNLIIICKMPPWPRFRRSNIVLPMRLHGSEFAVLVAL